LDLPKGSQAIAAKHKNYMWVSIWDLKQG
jgi:hypothetical protein